MKKTIIPESFKEQYYEKFKYGTTEKPFKEEYARDDPVIFAYYKLGKKIRMYQAYAIDQFLNNRYNAWCWGRRLGKSLTIAVLSLWTTWYNKLPTGIHNNTIVLIISQTYDASLKIIDDISNLIEAGDMWMERVTKNEMKKYFSSKLEGTNNKEQITMKISGKPNFIKAYPPTNRVKGNAASLIVVDEAAHLDTPNPIKFFDETVAPVISDNIKSKMLVTSTPSGKTGLFYEIFDPEDNQPNNKYARVWYGYEINDNEDYQIQAKIDRDIYFMNGKNRDWAQEREAEFINDEGNFFNVEDVQSMVDFHHKQVLDYNNPVDVGVDFGGTSKSHTVVTVATKLQNGLIYRMYHKVYPIGDDFSLLDDFVTLKTSFPNITNFIVDDCPAGWHIIKCMEEKGYPVIRMQFKSEKLKKYGQFRAKLHQGVIKSYKDEYLLKEMFAMTGDCKAPHGFTDDAIDSFIMATYNYIDENKAFRFYDIKGYLDDD